MSRRLFIILTVITLALGAVFVGFVLRDHKKAEQQGVEPTLFPDLFQNDRDTQNGSQDIGQGAIDNEPSSAPDQVPQVTFSPVSRLKRIIDEPVAGVTVYTEERVVPIVPAPEVEGVVKVYNFVPYATLVFGQEGLQVLHLKQALNRALPEDPLEINSVFDLPTKTKVIAFQTSLGFKADGVVGPATRQALTDSEKTFGTIDTETATALPDVEMVSIARYVKRTDGTIVEKDLSYNQQKTVHERSVVGALEGIFDNKGAHALMRYTTALGAIQTMITTVGSQQNPIPLDAGITFAVRSPDAKKLLYIIKKEKITEIRLYDFGSSKTTVLMTTPVGSWLPVWSTSDIVTLTTRASLLVDGVSYALDTKKATVTLLEKDTKGLLVLQSPKATKRLVGQATPLGYKLSIRTNDNVSVPLGIVTLPEKCIWQSEETLLCFAPKERVVDALPDEWYKGKFSFTDTLWSVDVATGASRPVVDIQGEYRASVDAIDPFIVGGTLYFKDKRTMTVWSYTL